MKSEDLLIKFFPVIYLESDFVKRTFGALNKLGFNADNTIACVGICRDEICQSFFEEVRRNWGHAFNLSSLTGMLFAGRTELMIAMSHSPNEEGRERYVFYSLPHIAIDKEGRIGICKRRGRKTESTACGALDVFQKELSLNNPSSSPFTKGGQRGITEKGEGGVEIDNSDIELSLMRMRLIKEMPPDHVPDLLELTKITQKVIQKDLENALNILVNTEKSDYAIITGIQIHGPDGNYIWPASHYAIVNGIREEAD